jgi:hypothetical protein
VNSARRAFQRRSAVVCTAILGLLACGRCDGQGHGGRTTATSQGRDESWTVASCESASSPPPTRVAGGKPPQDARVYLDGSASMKAFAGQGDRFADVLGSLRGALLDVGVVRTQVTFVGAGLEPVPHTGGFEKFDEKGFYTRSETNLGAVLDNEQKSLSDSPLGLLITDGVMSLHADKGEPGTIADCQRGSDVECLAVKVGKLIQSGRGVWIVGFRSAYRGKLFSERIKAGGGSLGNVKLLDRPFYLWVIADNPAKGRRLIERLFARLSLQPDGARAFALELSPGKIPWWLPSADQAPVSDSSLFPQGATPGAVRGKFLAAPAGQVPMQQVANQNLDGTAFGLRVPLQTTSLTEMPKEITPLWTYRPAYCLRWEGIRRAGNMRLRAQEDGGNLKFAMLSSSFGALAGRRVTLVQRLVREGNASEVVSHLEAWSTTDDRKITAGSRTLNFLGFLESLMTRLDLPASYDQPILKLDFK